MGIPAAFEANFAIPSPYVSVLPLAGVDLVQLLLQLWVYVSVQGGEEGKNKTPQKPEQQAKETSSAIMASLRQPTVLTYKEH